MADNDSIDARRRRQIEWHQAERRLREEREYLRHLPGDTGAVQRLVWGANEAEYRRMQEAEDGGDLDRPWVFTKKHGR